MNWRSTLVPVLLGDGTRLFGDEHIKLEDGPQVL